jgi:hypothetical protein
MMRTSALALRIGQALECAGWSFVVVVAVRRGAGAVSAPASNGVTFFTLGILTAVALAVVELRGLHRIEGIASPRELRAVGPLLVCACVLPVPDVGGMIRQLLAAGGWLAVGFWVLLEDPVARIERAWGDPHARRLPLPPLLPLKASLERRGDAWHDALSGVAHLEFAAGARQQHFHVPFNPPFTRLPQVSVACDDPEVQLTLGAVYAHGVRWEARRAGDARWPRSVPVRFWAEVAADVPEET